MYQFLEMKRMKIKIPIEIWNFLLIDSLNLLFLIKIVFMQCYKNGKITSKNNDIKNKDKIVNKWATTM